MTEAKIAVAGGTGFIGRHLVARLLAHGCGVVVLARGRPRLTGALEGAELRSLDLEGGALEGCALLVNLVGIKREAKGQSWDAIHVDLPRRLAAAAVDAGVPRMIHVSVAGADRAGPDAGPYLRSKARGEAALREVEGLGLTILRPGVVYGRGDDMLRNLADSVRAAPLFPAPRGGRSPIQPVHVDDVVEAVLRCIETPASAGRDYELVGPERLELRELVARVAAHARVDRPCVVLPAPAPIQRLAAAALERLSADPLITRSQLELLEAGVVGDPQPARDELGLEPRALDDAAIDDALREFSPRLPSLRLVPDPAAAAELAALAGDASIARSWIFAVIAVALLLAGPWLLAPWSSSIWLRMAGSEALLSVLALSVLGLRWRELLRPRVDALAWGLGAGVVMWAGAFALAALLARIAPQLWAETASLYAWADELPRASALALLGVIVAGEEIVWRGALGVGLASRGRLGPWLAVLASAGLFTLAHLSSGPPVLALAAALAGGAWAALAIRARSLFAAFVAHLLWDVTMLWLTPL